MDLNQITRFALVFIAALFTFALLAIAFFTFLRRTRADRNRLKPQSPSQKITDGRFTARKTKEWITVGEYDIFVHRVVEQMRGQQRIIFAEVEYKNLAGTESLNCRRNQWYLYARDGYSYEAESQSADYQYAEKKYFGSERFINPGMNARGWFAFKVANDSEISHLQFMTAFIGTKTVDIGIEEAIEKQVA